MNLRSLLGFSLVSAAAVCITGCTLSSLPTATSSGALSSAQISGRVHGGQQPVAGATIQLYTVGTSADGSASVPLLSQAVTTDSGGNFSLTNLYSCTGASLVYLTATGGTPGGSSVNPNLALMTALGPCSSLTSSTFIYVNELTTVAAVSALAPYMGSLTSIGSSPSDLNNLTSAFALANQYVSSSTGTSPGNSAPAGTTIPASLINTLGDAVAACINSSGGIAGDASTCGQFFELTTPGNSPAPTNTIAGLLYLANNPTLNTPLLYSLQSPSAPFLPNLVVAPPDFRIRPTPVSSTSLTIAPSVLTFPAGTVGTASTPQLVTVQNSTGAAVTLSGITLTGANASDFSQTNNCAGTLAASASCNVLVTITPSVAGARIGYLSVANSTPASPQYVTLTLNNVAPGLTSISPTSASAGSTSPLEVLLIGTNFLPTSMVQVGGSNRPTTYFSSTELVAQLSVADQAAAGALSVTVVNPPPGGGVSNSLNFTVVAPPPAPVITTLFPATFIVGAGNTVIDAVGSNLTSSTVLRWNGTNLTTAQSYSTYYGYYLVATVPGYLLTAPGTASITAYNASASPANSNVLTATITNPPVPTLTSISPSNGPINVATTVTLVGTGFTAASTVALNGSSIASTYVNSTDMTVTIPASSLTLPGNLSFTVTTPAPGGGTTGPQTYTAYIGIANNSMVYNPVNGLLYVSVPSSAGTPYGNSVVPVDPATGVMGTPIQVGSEPDRMAISSDGTILWVALDGASAVRQVNLTTGSAGLQFGFGGNSGVYDNPPTVYAMAALPGSPNSVIVSTSNEYYGSSVNIYDSGVLRGTSSSTGTENAVYALQVNGLRGEIYAGSSDAYYVYAYTSSGLTLKATGAASADFAGSTTYEMQVAGGNVYTDFGQVFDAEAGSLLGTFYLTGTTAANGPTIADLTLGEAFVLDDTASYNYGNYNQIQVFSTSNYTPMSGGVIPVSATASSTTGTAYASALTRWGANGLAFRTPAGIYSVQSNLVQNLSSVNADLGVTLAATGSVTTGSTTNYTATVTNAGPSAATNVTLVVNPPSSGVVTSVTPASGSCNTGTSISCDLGSLASGASTTVVIKLLQTTAGSAVMTVKVAGPQNDPVTSNNIATYSSTITGNAYNLTPTLTAVSPAAILSGSPATTITLTGSNFVGGATAMMGGTALPTSVTNSTTLTATVPSTLLTTLGWSTLSVVNPAPGGGTSATLPLSVFSVITLGANHIVYDPYSRKVMASVGSGSTSVTGNSIVAITPETATVGTAVPIGSQPENMALTSDGQILYTILTGSESVARFNMLTQQPDFTYQVPTNSSFDGGIALRGIATQPGTENTIALDIASFSGNAIYDFNPTTQTAAIRGQASGPYSGSCIQFLDAGDLLAFDTDTSGATFDHYTVTSAGFTYYNYSQYTESTLLDFGCFKLSGGLAFANAGGVANPATSPATQIGVNHVSGGGEFSTTLNVAPDASLQRVFYLVNTSGSTSYGAVPDGVQAFNENTFLSTNSLYLNMETIEGGTSYTAVDLIRWGQDGLAALTSGGHIYLLRGPAVVPQLLTTNTAAILTSSSQTSAAHGSGNTMLTLTGSNFIPGVAALWNGSYRTTTIVDATHVTVAIPASDLAAVGSATITITNPGASPSSGISFTIN